MKAIFSIVLFIHCVAIAFLITKVQPITVSPQRLTKPLLVKTVQLKQERVLPPVPQQEIIAEVPEEVQPEVISVEVIEVEEAAAVPEIVPDPQPDPKPKTTKKPKPKTQTKVKPMPSVKKKPQSKPKAKPKEKATSVKPKYEKQKPVKKEESKEEIARKQALINEALDSLNSAKNAAQVPTKTATTAQIQKIEGLKSSLVAIAAEENEFQTEGERSYYDELVHRLQLTLRLPEYGEVKIRLTLSSQGKFLKLVVVSSKSQMNRAYIEKTIPSVHFPHFGENFSCEKEHTFSLTLRNFFK